MDTRTGEMFKFDNEEKLIQAKKKNPYLKEVDCKEGSCEYFYMDGGKSFCKANRKTRREKKCFVTINKGKKNER